MFNKKKELFIKKAASEHVPGENEKIFWRTHAVERLRERKFKKNEIEESLKKCVLVEDYPNCLVLSYVGIRAVHVVVDIDMNNCRLFIITLYEPDDRWEDDRKRRKSKG
ncbi:MAG: DUF4258 domain-containing protein [Nitrospirae bacterium]|nr:DUF4258 domain-containing protein [Nitrospirota bacterium]MBF0592724.1 DUF4258 domain-containing protein [Nitrospirota bacterium]